eukprot:1151332-Pelagomonas_calceolata.AAC.1
MLLVSIQLVRLSHADSYAGPLWGAMPAAQRMVSREKKDKKSSTLSLQQTLAMTSHAYYMAMLIKYCEDLRPGSQLKASQQQHTELCKQFQGAKITPHAIFWVWWSYLNCPYPESV